MGLSIISCAFVFESHFDENILNQAPLWLTAVPISCILLASALVNSIDVHSERDECLRIFHGYNSTLRVCLTHFELLVTILYCSFSIYLLYCIEQPHSTEKQDEVLIDTTLLAAFFFLVFTMRQNGQQTLDLLFNQF